MNSFAQDCDTQTGLPQFPVRLDATGTDHRTVELGRTPRDDAERSPKRTPNARPTKQLRTGGGGTRFDHDRWYFHSMAHFPLLEHEEVVSLTRIVQCSENEDERIDAQQRIVVANLRWVTTIARRYVHLSDLDLADLVQEGVVGLMRASEKFDPSSGCRFLTYATYWIRQSVIRGIQNKGSTIRLPHHAHEVLTTIRRARANLFGALQRDPRADEIAHELGEETTKVELLVAASQSPDSLDRPVGPDNKATIGDLLANTNGETPEQCLLRTSTSAAIETALDELPERERLIIRLRFGLSGNREHTLAEIGRRLAVSNERIRQLEKRALEKLRDCCALDGLGIENAPT